MNQQLNNLLKKYESGLTNRKEETRLTQDMSQDTDLKKWFEFREKSQVEIPLELEDKMWQSLIRNNRKKRIRIYGSITAAASVLILISFFIFKKPQAEMSLAEKTAVLKEALAMTSTAKVIERQVIYEDDNIVIYTEKKQNDE